MIGHLDDIYQYAYINNTDSGSLRIVYGVPQGYVFGPLLFALFVFQVSEVYFICSWPNCFVAGKIETPWKSVGLLIV